MAKRQEIGTLGDHAGRFRIWLHCSCGHGKRFDAADLAQRLGADYPNARLVERARCEVCGSNCRGMTIEPFTAPGYASDGPRG